MYVHMYMYIYARPNTGKCPSARLATIATPPSTPTPGSEEGDWRGFPTTGGRRVYVCVVWCGRGEGEHIPK